MIIITGGAGFIGSCILARFNEAGREDLMVVDHLNDDLKKKNLEDKKFIRYFDKAEFLELILKDQFSGTEKIETVIHMGACSSTILTDAKYYQENNFDYSCHLAKWCLKHDIRFLYASSAATYGDGSRGYSDDDESTRLCQPLNLYGESKQNFDLWVLAERLEKKFVGFKFFNVFGPNEYHKGSMRSVIAKAYPLAAAEGKISLFKSYNREYRDGEQKRDFIYVKDAVDIVMFFYDRPDLGGIYNVGTGQARSWNDLAHALFAAVGKKASITYVDMPPEIRPRYQYFTQAQVSKLRAAGYKKPFMPLEAAVKEYAGFLKNNAHL